jgi:outer membrane protein, heavy metal efflux system
MNPNSMRLSITVSLVAISGCLSSESPELRPDEVLRDALAFRTPGPSPSGPAEGPLAGFEGPDWRTGPASWAGLLDLLLARNPDVRAARESSRALERAARSGGAWSDIALEGGPTMALGKEPLYGGFVGLGIALPFGGRPGRSRALQEEKARAAVVELRSVALERAFDLRSAYLRALASASALRIASESAEWARKGALLARRIAEAGGAAAVDVQILETEERSARLAVLEAEDRLASDREDLAALLALPPAAIPPLGALPGKLPGSSRIDPAGLRGALPSSHPGLRRLEAAHRVAEKALRVERAGGIPDLEVGIEAESEPGGGTVLGLPLGWTLPLWDANREGVAAAEADLASARGAYRAAMDGAVADLETAGARLGRLEARLRIMDGEILPTHRLALEGARKALEVSDFDPLRYVELERAYRLSVQSQAELVRETLAARTDLERAAGTPLFEMPGKEPGEK